MFLKDETLWLTQKTIGELFGKERSVITKHLRNIFASGELDEKCNVQKMHIGHSDKPVKIYNLDVIISVGYRVNSKRATRVLREFAIKGASYLMASRVTATDILLLPRRMPTVTVSPTRYFSSSLTRSSKVVTC